MDNTQQLQPAEGRMGHVKHRQDERGEGRVGLLIALIVVGVAIFLAVKVIPVRITAYEFKDHIRDECRHAAVQKKDEVIADRILEKARELEIPLNPRNLEVRRTRSEMIITASYEQPIDLKVYRYVYKFQTTERAPLF
jgi:hypothetical protein